MPILDKIVHLEAVAGFIEMRKYSRRLFGIGYHNVLDIVELHWKLRSSCLPVQMHGKHPAERNFQSTFTPQSDPTSATA